MKIFIAVPTYENISPDTFKSIYGLNRGGNWLVFDFVRGYDCAAARNNIALQTEREHADYVLMVDSDMVLPSDALINLLDDPKDVCLGYAAHRHTDNIYHGNTNTCRLYQPNGEKYFHYPLESEYTGAEMAQFRAAGKYKIEVHGGGMGVALIKADVFKRLNYPYFGWVNYPNGDVLSEDLFFCEECHKAGIPIYVDTRVGCGHIFRHIQWPD